MYIIISSLLGKGDSFNVFVLNSIFSKFDFVIPDFFLIELNKHTSEIQKRSKLNDEELLRVVDFVTRQISVIPQSEFNGHIGGARKISKGHEKDAPYVALSLKLNCPIFSGDKALRKIYPDKVCSPKEMLEKFYF